MDSGIHVLCYVGTLLVIVRAVFPCICPPHTESPEAHGLSPLPVFPLALLPSSEWLILMCFSTFPSLNFLSCGDQLCKPAEPERSGWVIKRNTEIDTRKTQKLWLVSGGSLTAGGGQVMQFNFWAQLIYTGSQWIHFWADLISGVVTSSSSIITSGGQIRWSHFRPSTYSPALPSLLFRSFVLPLAPAWSSGILGRSCLTHSRRWWK